MVLQRSPVLAKASDWTTNICAQFFVYCICPYCLSHPLGIKEWVRTVPVHMRDEPGLTEPSMSSKAKWSCPNRHCTDQQG